MGVRHCATGRFTQQVYRQENLPPVHVTEAILAPGRWSNVYCRPKDQQEDFWAETEGDGRVLLWRPLGNGQKVQLAMDRNRSILWTPDSKGIMDASTAVASDLSCAEASCNRREGFRAKRAKQCPALRTLRWVIPLFSVGSGTLFASLLIVVITCRYDLCLSKMESSYV